MEARTSDISDAAKWSHRKDASMILKFSLAGNQKSKEQEHFFRNNAHQSSVNYRFSYQIATTR